MPDPSEAGAPRSAAPRWTPPDLAPLAPAADFEAQAAELGVEFDPGDVEKLGRYLALLLDANKAFNLTAITDPAEAWTKHILDSLTLMPLLAEAEPGAKVADIGSGGGAPAIPLAVVLPHLSFTLIESTGKKADFLRAAAETLGLANIEVVADRAETVGQDHKRYRERFDFVTARALGRLAVLAELAIPLLKPGGAALAIKGAQAEQELEEAAAALAKLNAACDGVVETPTGRIIVLRKLRSTPRLYPRRPGEPARAPLH